MTEDEVLDYCEAALAQAEARGLTPENLVVLAGYLATAAINHVHRRDRAQAMRIFVTQLRQALALSAPLADGIHAEHDDDSYRH